MRTTIITLLFISLFTSCGGQRISVCDKHVSWSQKIATFIFIMSEGKKVGTIISTDSLKNEHWRDEYGDSLLKVRIKYSYFHCHQLNESNLSDTIYSKIIAVGMVENTNELATVGLNSVILATPSFRSKYDKSLDALSLDTIKQQMNRIAQKNKKRYESINYKLICENSKLSKKELDFLYQQYFW